LIQGDLKTEMGSVLNESTGVQRALLSVQGEPRGCGGSNGLWARRPRQSLDDRGLVGANGQADELAILGAAATAD
jgi:hypothetical protein